MKFWEKNRENEKGTNLVENGGGRLKYVLRARFTCQTNFFILWIWQEMYGSGATIGMMRDIMIMRLGITQMVRIAGTSVFYAVVVGATKT